MAAPEAALSPRQGHLLSIPVLLRTLALLGYYQGGERTRQLVQDPLWQARHATPERVGTAAQNTALLGYRKDTLAVLAAMLAVTLARMRRGYRANRVGTIGLTYPDRFIRVPQGLSLRQACATAFRMLMSAAAAAAALPVASAFFTI